MWAELVQNLDFAPTLLDAAGVDVPPDMQGRSLLEPARGKTPAGWGGVRLLSLPDEPEPLQHARPSGSLDQAVQAHLLQRQPARPEREDARQRRPPERPRPVPETLRFE